MPPLAGQLIKVELEKCDNQGGASIFQQLNYHNLTQLFPELKKTERNVTK